MHTIAHSWFRTKTRQQLLLLRLLSSELLSRFARTIIAEAVTALPQPITEIVSTIGSMTQLVTGAAIVVLWLARVVIIEGGEMYLKKMHWLALRGLRSPPALWLASSSRRYRA